MDAVNPCRKFFPTYRPDLARAVEPRQRKAPELPRNERRVVIGD
jgi:hypothetical protein